MDNTLNLSTLHAFTYTIKPLLDRPDANGIPLGSIAAHIISTLSVSIEDDKECPGFRFTTLIRRICYCSSFYQRMDAIDYSNLSMACYTHAAAIL